MDYFVAKNIIAEQLTSLIITVINFAAKPIECVRLCREEKLKNQSPIFAHKLNKINIRLCQW